MTKQLLALAATFLAAQAASAAIIYEPVQYQYKVDGETYYYGGRNPRAVEAAITQTRATRQSPPNHRPEGAFVRPDRTPAVYSDAARFMNLSPYGVTQTDAANEANASVPRYFRMSDVLSAATVDADGTLHVPANAPTVERARAVSAPTTRPAPTAIIIIPRKPAAPRDAKPVGLKVANAR